MMENWKEVRTKGSYEREIGELKRQIECCGAVAKDRERLIVRNKELVREVEKTTARLEKNCNFLRARLKEILAANVALKEENEYLQKVVNAAAKMGEPFMKAVYENMEV